MQHGTLAPHHHKTTLSESIECMKSLINTFSPALTKYHVYYISHVNAIYEMLSIMCLSFSVVVPSKLFMFAVGHCDEERRADLRR